ncbi:MAG: tRNA lysidine(34) synthetase TilS [Alphaproteobacteria bacterium]|nr:tRNA lysidine(34) synthetase TilS [Alphaproteobacteria bacterium]
MLIDSNTFKQYIPENFNSFVVGLSGGADSLCLTLLMNEYIQTNNYKLVACIVDHKLRAESSTEILPIIAILQNNNIEYKVLVWEHDKIDTKIEVQARQARYNLLYQFCKSISSNCLCTAHHALDQWETFFMRLSRGSGIRGLASINTISDFKDIKLLRPLLHFTPQDIKDTLKYRFNITEYVKDSMNYDTKFERVKWRQSYEELSNNKYNLSIKNINQSIDRIQRANDFIDSILKGNINQIYSNSYLNLKLFKTQHIEMQIRILRYIVTTFFPEKQIISYSLLERMVYAIIDNNFTAVNFCNLVFKRDKTKNIKVYIENRRK